jgi:hypothetical protein
MKNDLMIFLLFSQCQHTTTTRTPFSYFYVHASELVFESPYAPKTDFSSQFAENELQEIASQWSWKMYLQILNDSRFSERH